MEKTTKVEERIVPITLLESGESVMPKFTALDDLEPPEWSAFSPKNKGSGKEKEKVVPIRMEDEDVSRSNMHTPYINKVGS